MLYSKIYNIKQAYSAIYSLPGKGQRRNRLKRGEELHQNLVKFNINITERIFSCWKEHLNIGITIKALATLKLAEKASDKQNHYLMKWLRIHQHQLLVERYRRTVLLF